MLSFFILVIIEMRTTIIKTEIVETAIIETEIIKSSNHSRKKNIFLFIIIIITFVIMS